MASKRLEQETTLKVNERRTADLCEIVTAKCEAGDCEFLWIIEDEEGDPVPLPNFCPCCGRRVALSFARGA